MSSFKIGDYIYYNDEYYTGRGYGYSTSYGYIIKKGSFSNCFAIIKQYGGKIWYYDGNV